MFQSSRMASGNCRLQVSMASSPFSASMIRKSRPSRIRRATLRMTLESSTTKQVFITSSLQASRAHPPRFHSHPNSDSLSSPALSRRRRFGAKIEHPVDIEDDQQLAVEPINPRRNAAKVAVEIDRIRLALAVRQLEHFA